MLHKITCISAAGENHHIPIFGFAIVIGRCNDGGVLHHSSREPRYQNTKMLLVSLSPSINVRGSKPRRHGFRAFSLGQRKREAVGCEPSLRRILMAGLDDEKGRWVAEPHAISMEGGPSFLQLFLRCDRSGAPR
jgi:hypothetical protein